MFGKRCSLCGEKLNSRGICTECGLDNSKSDKNYRINRSDCDGMPLTHVHEEKEKHRPDRKADHREINHKETNHKKRDYGKQGYRMNESDMTGKKRRKHVQTPDITNRRRPLKIVILAIIVIAVLGNLYEEHKYDIEYAIGDAVQGVFQDTGDQKTNDTDKTDYDHYQYVTREIPKEGERADYELSSGNYVAGVEIPEGIYTVTPKDDYDAVQIDDPENSIYLYEYTEGKKDKIEDIRLYKGAHLTLKCKTTVKLHTDNAQDVEAMETAGQSNPLTESVDIKGQKTLTAGRDLEPGIYDLRRVSGAGNVDIIIYSDEKEEINSWSQGLSEDGIDGETFHYLVIPENATLEVSEDLKIRLTPSKQIASTDYYGFYNR
ncbi:Uncharacterised protein [Dorea longicatena]|uniref:Uncharacterized protein n=1 Tax=Dorea longicatena TaxID=88431 RepID=A0A564U0H3_9FIRM|nr:hypothetical protein [Dorea longicatena]VUX13021.1 Uncharacterised protein [Dorea longicatena]